MKITKKTTKLARNILLSLFTLVLASSPVNVLALDGVYDRQFYANNNVLYYGPDACSTNTSSVGSGSVGSFVNPVYRASAPDPTAIRGDDGKFYVYATGGELLQSNDMSSWKRIDGNWKMKGAPNDADGSRWAPDIVKIGSKYVLTYTIPTGTPEHPGGGQPKIGYAIGDKAGGDFRYKGSLSLPYEYSIDSQIFIDDDGKTWLVWGGGVINIIQIKLDGDTLKTVGQSKRLLTKGGVGSSATIEGAWIYKKNGWYYLLYSQGSYKHNGTPPYRVLVARSKTVNGSYTPDSSMKPVLEGNSKIKNPGHNSVITDASGTDWMVYSGYFNGNSTRMLMIDKISYENGWPVINSGSGPSTTRQPGSDSSASANSTSSGASSANNGVYNVVIANPNGKQFHSHDNSIANIESANSGNFQSIDIDINESKDGVLFASHNPNLVKKTWTQIKKSNPGTQKLSAMLTLTAKYDLQANLDIKPWGNKWDDATFGRIADMANNLNAKVTIKASTDNKNLANSLSLAQNHGFWVRSNGKPYAGNGWKGGVWHKPTTTSINTTAQQVVSNTPDSCTCPNPSASTTSASLAGTTNLEKIYNYFLGKGLSPVQSAGIIGNIAIESGGFPQRKQSTPSSETYPDPSNISSGWGLIQWTPGSKIISLLKSANLQGDPGDLGTQLDLIWAHMHNKPPITKGSFSIPEYKQITDVNKAVDYFEDKIEGAGKPNLDSRHASAKLALDQFGNGLSTSSASSTLTSSEGCGSTDTGAVTGNIVQTAINYAWSDRNTSQHKATDKKPSYAAATEKAKSNGKYTGDQCFGGGVDCGAFITRVMQDSGADPNYGGGGNTAVQLKYLQDHPNMYQEIHPSSTADLQPGDIAIQNNSSKHHTYMYVGKQDGFDSTIASASQCQHAPWAGSDKPADPTFRWFRYLGNNGGDTVDV